MKFGKKPQEGKIEPNKENKRKEESPEKEISPVELPSPKPITKAKYPKIIVDKAEKINKRFKVLASKGQPALMDVYQKYKSEEKKCFFFK